MFKKCAICDWVVRPHPSAIFDGMDDEARRIWLIKPYISSFGKDVVVR